jgi:hypothetical protein
MTATLNVCKGTGCRVTRRWLELGDIDGIEEQDRTIVQTYNRDDCLSARALRDWLEEIRSTAVGGGATIPRPVADDGAVSEALSDWQLKIANLIAHLTQGVSSEPAERTIEQQARWLLAYNRRPPSGVRSWASLSRRPSRNA